MNFTTKYRLIWLLIVFPMSMFFSCDNEQKSKAKLISTKYRTDLTHSYSNTDQIKTKHLHLDLKVDFDKKSISGVARHKMLNLGSDTAIFDIKNLDIQK